MPLSDPDPEWFDRPGGALVAVVVSVALCVAVSAIGWGAWTGTTLMAAGASLVALGLSLANLRDARRRARRPRGAVTLYRYDAGELDLHGVDRPEDQERFVENLRWVDDDPHRPGSAP